MRLLWLIPCVLLSSALMPAQQPTQAQIDLLRSDIKSKKQQILTQVLGLNDADSQQFWPIYREYEVELSRIGDEKIQLLKDLDRDWDSLDIAKSDTYARKALKLEKDRAKLKEKYYKRIHKAMSSMTAAKWLQIENMMLTTLDMQAQAMLPLIK